MCAELAAGGAVDLESAGPSSVDLAAELSQQTSLSDPLSPSQELSEDESDMSSDVEIN